MVKKEQQKPSSYIPMPLTNSKLNRGEVKSYIDSLSGTETREIALAEYYYFTGMHSESEAITSRYIDHSDLNLKMSAWFMYVFNNLFLNRQEKAMKGLDVIYDMINSGLSSCTDQGAQAMLVFVANAGNVLLHLKVSGVPSLNNYLSLLPPGLKIFGCYVLAHQAYLNGEYEKGIGIVETSLALEGESYLIPTIYLYLSGAMNAMSLEKVELGKEFFRKAFTLAKDDGLFEPIGEHHGLLQGLIEICLKKNEKAYYEKIIGITYQFSYGWRRVHNPITNNNVADTLTTIEFTVAMLANKGWTNAEIADYLELSINTVKSHITNVFNKLGINSRKELNEFMLK